MDTRPQRDAHLESTVPPWFFWAVDALVMCGASFVNLFLAPFLQHLVAPGGPLRVQWLSWLVLPGDYLNTFRSFDESLTLLLATVPTTLIAIGLMDGYRSVERLSRTRLFLSAVAGPLFGLSAFTLVLFALRHQQWSRVLLFTDTALVMTGLVGYRMALRTYKLRRIAAGRYLRATAFVGRLDDIGRVYGQLTTVWSGLGYRPAGYFETEGSAAAPADLPRLGSVDQVAATLVHTPIDLMIVVVPDRGAPWLAEVIRACDYMRVAVQVIPATMIELASTLEDLRAMPNGSPVPLPGVFLQPRNIDSGALFLKRLFDAAAASLLLLLLTPLFLAIAIAIKLSTPREDIFYRWRVIGYQGRPFTGYKFTTMVADADERRAGLQHLNEMTGPVFKIKNDPRITPLGRLLRKFSLNELPQLWSVLVGDMSLVGPRPAGSWEIAGYQEWHKRKLSFRPGITCLWQVRGRNKINSFDDWVRMDLEYIDNWSLWLDARILLRTAWVVITGSGS